MKKFSEKSIQARINRKLCLEEQMLRKARGVKAIQDFGYWYVVNVNRNSLVDSHVDLESFARELGLLCDSEIIEITG